MLVAWITLGLGLTLNDNEPSDVQIENNIYRTLLVNFGSFVVVWLWIAVFKPAIPGLANVFGCNSQEQYLPLDNNEHQNSHFVNVFTKYGFYEVPEDIKYNLSSSDSLAILFGISMITTNLAVRYYKVDIIYYYVLVGVGVGSALLSILLQLPILIAHFKSNDGMNLRFRFAMFNWLMVIALLVINGVALFFVFFPYNGWSSIIDKSYEETMSVRNIFILVQGSISLLICLGVVIWLLTYVPRCMSSCWKLCNEKRQAALDDVYGSTVVEESDSLLE
jgi:hypothetical protein